MVTHTPSTYESEAEGFAIGVSLSYKVRQQLKNTTKQNKSHKIQPAHTHTPGIKKNVADPAPVPDPGE